MTTTTMTELTTSCAKHPELAGVPCARCGTFSCTNCLDGEVCRTCLERGVSAPTSETVAGFGIRAGARIIDLVVHTVSGAISAVPFAIVYGVLSYTGAVKAGAAANIDKGFGLNIAALLASVFSAAVSTAICGASVGKLIVGLRVVSLDGTRPRLGGSVIREFAYLIDALFFGLIGKSAMEASALAQRHGDRWGGTAVIRASTIRPAFRVSGARMFMGLAAGLAVYATMMATAMILKVL